jgi:hypothetical protein
MFSPAGDVAQVVKHLPSKRKALSSKPNATKNNIQHNFKTDKMFYFVCMIWCVFLVIFNLYFPNKHFQQKMFDIFSYSIGLSYILII